MKIDCHAQSFHAIVGPTNVLMVSRLLLLPVWSIRLRRMPIGVAPGHCRPVNQRAARLGRAGIARWPLAGFMQPIIAKPKMKRPRQLWPDGCGCKSCGTRRRDHKFLGYCTRCHPIIYRTRVSTADCIIPAVGSLLRVVPRRNSKKRSGRTGGDW